MKKKKAVAPYHILVYIEKCEQRIKKFKTEKEMGKFIDNYYKLHPEYADKYSDYWVDFAVTNISGDVHFFTDSLKVTE